MNIVIFGSPVQCKAGWLWEELITKLQFSRVKKKTIRLFCDWKSVWQSQVNVSSKYIHTMWYYRQFLYWLWVYLRGFHVICPKVHLSEGSPVRRFTCPKVHQSEGSSVRRFTCPIYKIHTKNILLYPSSPAPITYGSWDIEYWKNDK